MMTRRATGRIEKYTDEKGEEHDAPALVWKNEDPDAEVDPLTQPIREAIDIPLDVEVDVDLNADDDEDVIAKSC